MSLKTKLLNNFNSIVEILPNKEIKKVIFFEMLNSMDYNLGYKLCSNVLQSKNISLTKEIFLEEIKFLEHISSRMLTENNFNIQNSFKILKERKWETFYMFIDIHQTILLPDYGGMAKFYYPKAKEVLKDLSLDKRIKLVLFTCSYPNEIEEYLEFFKKDDIHFDYINKTNVENTKVGYFQDKPYMNVILDDKAGFLPNDWYIIDWILRKY